MLICNNCFTQNEDHVITCVNCKMTGDFTHAEEANKIRTIPKKKEGITCKNCGSHDPGEGTKCVHCHFPNEAKSQQVNGQSRVKYKVIG